MEKHRSELRKKLRKRRQALNAEQQAAASFSLCNTLKSRQELVDSQHIALYLANDGEINPVQIQQYLWQSGKHCYLPVVGQSGSKELTFIEYRSDTPLVENRFGILEPSLKKTKAISPEMLDIVLVPLTGFDEQGKRLGMGGGFYDRTFAFNRTSHKPILIGLAYECQKVDSIPVEYWDIPMVGIATDHQFYSI